MAGNTTWINWSKIHSQINAATGKAPPPLGPHGMRVGMTYTICGNIHDAKPARTRSGKPVVSFMLRRKSMAKETIPLRCVAFGGVAEHLAAHVRQYGIDNPICLIGTYQPDGEDHRFLVARSRLPTLDLALSTAVRLGERFQHCS